MKQFSKSSVQPWGLELVNKYPLIFLEANTDNMAWALKGHIENEDYCNLRFGFECDEGWKAHIENIARMATEIVEYLRKSGLKNEEAYIHSCIVKEKLGGLRWQGDYVLPPLFRDLWNSYYWQEQDQSYGTCEVTGKYGKLRETRNGERAWKRTLCAEEATKQGYDLEDWEKEKLEREKSKVD